MPGWGGFKQVTSNVIGSTTISLPAYSAGRTYNPSLYCTIWSGATTSTIVTDSVRVNVIGSTTTLISRAESLNLIAAMLEAIRNLLSTLGR
ncbi:MAG: hypothetical protein HYT48_01800 [Candidatus Vogelbacteria bacterium]|nr:hypothetical protein [Candidatus Vogelbacteria bacterium]